MHFNKYIFEIWGAKITPNAIFVETKNLENLSKRNFYLKIFFIELIEEEIRAFLKKEECILEKVGTRKNDTKLIFV